MLYYYAYSGHKYGLDGVRRGAALIKALKREGIDMQMLVSDFRAGLAARELGADGAVTIETLLDVDAVAKRGDGVVLDTPEDVSLRMERYCDEFSPLLYVTNECSYHTAYCEAVIKPVCQEDEDCIEAPIVDPKYFEILPKEDRKLFFLGDADYDKVILAHREFFEGLGMELLLGDYFFVKYEDELAEIFDRLHEPEEYADVIRSSSMVVTASAQCAFESRASEAETLYIRNRDDSSCLLKKLSSFGIKIIDDFDKNTQKNIIESLNSSTLKVSNNLNMATMRLRNG